MKQTRRQRKTMSTISDIKNMNAGEIVPGPLEVEVLEAWDQKQIGGQYPKTKQRVKLGQGRELMFAEFEGHPDMKVHEGKRLRLLPSQNKEGKLNSLIVVDSDYNNKVYKNLRVTKAAKVYVLGEEGSQGQGNASAGASGGQSQGSDSAAQPKQTTFASQPGGKVNIGLEMNRLQNFYIRCLQGAQYISTHSERDLGVSLTPEQFQATTASLYIQGTRDGLHKLEKHGPWGANDGVQEPSGGQPQPASQPNSDDDIPF